MDTKTNDEIRRLKFMSMLNMATIRTPLSGVVMRKVLRPETKKILRNVIER